MRMANVEYGAPLRTGAEDYVPYDPLEDANTTEVRFASIEGAQSRNYVATNTNRTALQGIYASYGDDLQLRVTLNDAKHVEVTLWTKLDASRRRTGTRWTSDEPYAAGTTFANAEPFVTAAISALETDATVAAKLSAAYSNLYI